MAHTLSQFPVAFRSRLDSAPFKITSVFILFYAVTPQIADSVSVYIKYLFTLGLAMCFTVLALTRWIKLRPLFLLAPLLLSIIGAISFAYSIFLSPGMTTFSSALVPLILAAMPLLIGARATRTDGAAVTDYLFCIFAVTAVSHVLWQIVGRSLGWEESVTYYGFVQTPLFSGTLVLVYLMLLSGLFRRNLMLALSIGLIGVALALRPTSTLALAVLFAAGIIALHRWQLYRLLRAVCQILVAGILVGNLAILLSQDLAHSLYSFEPSIKEEALSSDSNNEFRLGVIDAARDEFRQHSLWVGEAFIGQAAVDPRVYLPWIEDYDLVPIHSDFIVMIVQGGLIGYGLFAGIFVGMASLCAKGARLAHAGRDGGSTTLFNALQAMNIVFILYISPQPTMQLLQYTLPYLMLIPLAVFLAREQARFLG